MRKHWGILPHFSWLTGTEISSTLMGIHVAMGVYLSMGQSIQEVVVALRGEDPGGTLMPTVVGRLPHTLE